MFGFGKSAHKKQLDALSNLTGQTYEKMLAELQVRRPDGRLRLFIFSLALAHSASASLMKAPDAVLNDLVSSVIRYCLSERATFVGNAGSDQEIATAGGALLQDFLHRWDTALELARNSRESQCLTIIAGMLHDVVSDSPPSDDSATELFLPATLAMQLLHPLRKKFKELT